TIGIPARIRASRSVGHTHGVEKRHINVRPDRIDRSRNYCSAAVATGAEFGKPNRESREALHLVKLSVKVVKIPRSPVIVHAHQIRERALININGGLTC